MAIALEDVDNVISATTGVTITVAGVGKIILAGAGDDTASVQNFAITSAGNAMTQITEATGTGQWLSVHRFYDPADGATVIDSDAGSSASILMPAQFTGVDTAGTPIGTRDGSPVDFVLTESGTGTVATGTAVVSQAGDLVVSFMHCNGAVSTAQAAATGTDQTNIQIVDHASNATMACSTQPGAASVVPSWGTFPGNRRWTVISINLRPATGGSIAHISAAYLSMLRSNQ